MVCPMAMHEALIADPEALLLTGEETESAEEPTEEDETELAPSPRPGTTPRWLRAEI